MARLDGKTILARLRKQKTNTAHGMLMYCDFTLKFVGSGVFRNVYHIVGSDYLVKVPIMTQGKKNVTKKSIAHSLAEHAMYKRVLRAKKYAAIRDMMPEIVGVTQSGMLVIKKYRSLGRVTDAEREFLEKVNTLTRTWMGEECDLHDANLRRDKDGQIKIIDLGYFLWNHRFEK